MNYDQMIYEIRLLMAACGAPKDADPAFFIRGHAFQDLRVLPAPLRAAVWFAILDGDL